jgi:hypothetical protein
MDQIFCYKIWLKIEQIFCFLMSFFDGSAIEFSLGDGYTCDIKPMGIGSDLVYINIF